MPTQAEIKEIFGKSDTVNLDDGRKLYMGVLFDDCEIVGVGNDVHFDTCEFRGRASEAMTKRLSGNYMSFDFNTGKWDL